MFFFFFSALCSSLIFSFELEHIRDHTLESLFFSFYEWIELNSAQHSSAQFDRNCYKIIRNCKLIIQIIHGIMCLSVCVRLWTINVNVAEKLIKLFYFDFFGFLLSIFSFYIFLFNTLSNKMSAYIDFCFRLLILLFSSSMICNPLNVKKKQRSKN